MATFRMLGSLIYPLPGAGTASLCSADPFPGLPHSVRRTLPLRGATLQAKQNPRCFAAPIFIFPAPFESRLSKGSEKTKNPMISHRVFVLLAVWTGPQYILRQFVTNVGYVVYIVQYIRLLRVTTSNQDKTKLKIFFPQFFPRSNILLIFV